MSTFYGRTPPWQYPDAPPRRHRDCACGGTAETEKDGSWPGRCQECEEVICETCASKSDVCAACEPAFAERERRENALTVFAALSTMSKIVAGGGA